jgi:putative acyl-CoA dehydrogenase
VPTHEVVNVGTPWSGVNVFTSDASLSRIVADSGASPAQQAGLVELGALAGSNRAQEWARLANAYPPVLRTHDRFGLRIDEVEFHPAWHELTAVAVRHGLHAAAWDADRGADAHLVRAAGFFVWSQVEQGHGCPISMTYAVLPSLRHSPDLAARFEPGLTSLQYDFGLRDPALKCGLLAGMAMTEKQGGSDVRANTTRAEPAGDDSYRLTGHKWFCSAPMCDLFLVLAQCPEGLSCFAVPRVLPGGGRNAFLLQRLKDKLGNRSNASAEVEFDHTVGWLVGEPGRGVRTIIDMVTMTRLDCVIGAAALQRAALTQALHHARHRMAFGRLLIDQPLMQDVLAELSVEVEAATVLFARLAHAVDAGERVLLRLAVAAAKYWVCKRSPTVVAELLECLGGGGYVEESPLPRYYREAPLNSIWEGSGNVIALDVVRAIAREPAAVDALDAELQASAGLDARFDAARGQLVRSLAAVGTDADADARQARALAAGITTTLQAGLLLRLAGDERSTATADGFLATGLDAAGWGCSSVPRSPMGSTSRRAVLAPS